MRSLGKRLSTYLAFTRSEQNVLIFLVGAFILGSGLRLFSAKDTATLPDTDSARDSAFTALSAQSFRASETDQPPLVNINTATKDELIALPGIGEVTAERIIRYRERSGPFHSANDLLKVKGMTKKKLEQLHELITIQ